MTHEEIVRMAREAGFGPAAGWAEFFPMFERFADLAASAEREACAQVCAGIAIPKQILGAHPDYLEGKHMALSQCAAAIRARGAQAQARSSQTSE